MRYTFTFVTRTTGASLTATHEHGYDIFIERRGTKVPSVYFGDHTINTIKIRNRSERIASAQKSGCEKKKCGEEKPERNNVKTTQLLHRT